MSEINREDAIANVALTIWNYPNELYTSLNCFENCQELAERALSRLPSAESVIKPISYTDCSNAMLKMWIDNVLTDGEYNKIMDKLNAKHRGE